MSDEITRIQSELEDAKATLNENLATLERKARDLTDWRLQVTQHPMGAVGLGMLSGVAAALILNGRRTRYVAPSTFPDGTVAVPAASLLDNPVVSRVMDALVAVAAAKAATMLDGLLPSGAAETGNGDVGP